MVFKKLLDKWSLKAISHRLNRRNLQEELDFHRLFLLTSYYRLAEAAVGAEELADTLNQEAQKLGLDGTKTAVQDALSLQLADICKKMHRVLLHANDGAAITATKAAQALARSRSVESQGLGRVYRTATTDNQEHLEDTEEESKLDDGLSISKAALSDAFAAAHGFSLCVSPSGCQQPEAGDGLWLNGSASMGQIVALYPGVAYTPLYHRQIPGYPLVARTNSYLFARFDGTVLDGKPWGRGNPGTTQPEESWPIESLNEAEQSLSQLESRNPLALAHIANHPPDGTTPNVVVAAVDFKIADIGDVLRRYFPIRSYEEMMTSQTVVPGAALVATRPICDEEVFLNYRLNPNAPGGLPSWYTSVDTEEDARRWA